MSVLDDVDPSMASTLLSVEALMRSLVGAHPGPAGAAALTHLQGGSRIRARLGVDAAHKLGLDTATAVGIGAACELLHNASLVHDDIHDGALTRRGRPTVCVDQGLDVAICAGDLLLSAAFGALASTRSVCLGEALARMHHRISEVVHGQVADLTSKGADATLASYTRVAAAKSAPLLALPIELALIMAGLSDHVPKAEQAASAFAIAYQAADDIGDVDEDAARGSLNLVVLLEVEMSRESALSAARGLVADYYRVASERASSLPRHAGELLCAIASHCATAAQRTAVSA
jgi:geranylgeranyl diphosphate synthase type II